MLKLDRLSYVRQSEVRLARDTNNVRNKFCGLLLAFSSGVWDLILEKECFSHLGQYVNSDWMLRSEVQLIRTSRDERATGINKKIN